MPTFADGDGPVNRDEAKARFREAIKDEKHKPHPGPNGEPDPRDKHTRDDSLDDPEKQESD